MSKKNNFLDLIKKHRETKKEEKFEGTFLEYLEVVQENPGDTSDYVFAIRCKTAKHNIIGATKKLRGSCSKQIRGLHQEPKQRMRPRVQKGRQMHILRVCCGQHIRNSDLCHRYE